MDYFTVGNHRLQIAKKLAEGSFAYVYIVNDLDDGCQYALKRILLRDQSMMKQIESEVSLMKKLPRHKSIVKYIDSSVSRTSSNYHQFDIVMELCTGNQPPPAGHLSRLFQPLSLAPCSPNTVPCHFRLPFAIRSHCCLSSLPVPCV
eukprot:TRINITY_DN945_c0_g1_i3.p1 TRINITY_DN945_c0_g1~~TRINITY_DN945_c0_g1_i3.p1  ORF type:complete len:147 (-),score=14.89 TRINITY_DN945_c0_g1_i3:76-516(-)